MDITLEELESRLGITVPSAYREYVSARSFAELETLGFDPKTLLVLNLKLQELEVLEGIRSRFFLCGDGCGNYCFIDLERGADEVLLWAHDPVGIEKVGSSLIPFLQSATQDLRIDRPMGEGWLYVTRAEHPNVAVLQPILMSEWREVIEQEPDIQYLGRRTHKNPFTGEAIHIDAPGLACLVSDEATILKLVDGGLIITASAPGRSIANALAARLHGVCFPPGG